MENYGDIIGRIAEIVINGQTQNNSTQKILIYRGFYVQEQELEEFKKLLATEKAFCLLTAGIDSTKKNDELIQICDEKIAESTKLLDSYMKLREILKRAAGKPCSALSEHSGYYIPSEHYFEFCDLCEKLKVGPYAILKSQSKEESQKSLAKNVINNKQQRERIKNYLATYYNQDLKNAYLITESDSLDRDVLFENAISLGFKGLLTIELVVEIRNYMSEIRFNQLLATLKTCNIFNSQTIDKIKSVCSQTEAKSLTTDDIVAFLAQRENLNIESLRIFIPTLGIFEYQYMIDELFKLNVISVDDYIKMTKEYLGNKDLPIDGFDTKQYQKVVDENFGSPGR